MPKSSAPSSATPEVPDIPLGLLTSPGPADVRQWMTYDRPAEYESVPCDVQILTRDGTLLSARLYRPGRGGQPVLGQFPSIVSQFTPYPIEMFELRHEYLAERGYNVLVGNVRGSGNSGGKYSNWFQEVEAEDNYDIIEWLAAQSFSTGVVGQTGDSYGSITACRVVALNPPSLKAIAPVVSPTNIYEWVYPGGVPTSNPAWWSGQAPVIDTAAHARTLQFLQTHELFDEHWKQIATTDKLASSTIPALFIGGYYDIFKEGGFDALQKQPEQTWLLYGPWVHMIPFIVPGKAPEVDLYTAQLIASTGLNSAAEMSPEKSLPFGLVLHWFDHWLNPQPATILPPARVISYEDTSAVGTGQWLASDQWPAPAASVKQFYPTSEGGLTIQVPPASVTSYSVDPFDGPSASAVGSSPTDELRDQALSDQRQVNSYHRYAGGRTTFTTRPFDSDTVVAGPVTLHLTASITADDTYFVSKLEAVLTDGRVIPIEVGSLRARLRTSREQLETVTPGVPYNYTIALGHTHWRFKTGEQLRVTIGGGDYPRILPTAPAGVVTVHHGGGTSLEVSILT